MRKSCQEAGWFDTLIGRVNHDFIEVERKIILPRTVHGWELNMIHDPYNYRNEGELQQAYLKKNLNGCTTILMKCTLCGEFSSQELVGR